MKNMKVVLKYLKLPILVLLVFVANSCGPKITPIPYYKLSDEFKSYCLFQSGTSWEYYSSSIDWNDIVQVTDVQENKWLNEFNEHYNYQAFDMIVSQNNIGLSFIELTAGSTLNAVNTMNSQMWLFFDNGDYRLIFDAKYPMGEEQILGEHEGAYKNIELIPSMELRGNTYTDVYHTKVTDYYEQGFGDFDFYLAKSYGMIKMLNVVSGDTTLLEMVSSNTIQ